MLNASWQARTPWCWWAVCLLLAAPALAVAWQASPGFSSSVLHGFDLQPTGRTSAHNAFDPWWRWFTAAWVHWNPGHLTLNIAGVAGLAALGRQARAPWPWALAWLMAWPLTNALSLAIAVACPAFLPAFDHEGGLSGALHAGVAIVAVGLLLGHGHGLRARRVGQGLLALLALKLSIDVGRVASIVGSVHDASGIGLDVRAHASGVLVGLVLGLTAVMLSRQGPVRDYAQPA